MKRKYAFILCFILILCCVLSSCGDSTIDRPPASSTSTSFDNPADMPIPKEYSYGRLSLEDFLLIKTGNNIRFTLQFEKKTYNPGDDIHVTVYVSNYSGEDIHFVTNEPIYSRQQLIHASLQYGGGIYEVPITSSYVIEQGMEEGTNEAVFPNRFLISTSFVIHLSQYTNVEHSIFGKDFRSTYQFKLWVGDDEYDYSIEIPISYTSIDHEDVRSLQNICVPPSYVKVEGDIRFTIQFDKTEYSLDDDIVMNVKVENIGNVPITLYFNADISDPIYYIRAAMKYSQNGIVRDTSKPSSEIPGFSTSATLLKSNQSLERNIVFYTSDFMDIQNSIFTQSVEGQRSLKVYLCVKDGVCEIDVPLTGSEFCEPTYEEHIPAPIVTSAPLTTTAVSVPIPTEE